MNRKKGNLAAALSVALALTTVAGSMLTLQGCKKANTSNVTISATSITQTANTSNTNVSTSVTNNNTSVAQSGTTATTSGTQEQTSTTVTEVTTEAPTEKPTEVATENTTKATEKQTEATTTAKPTTQATTKATEKATTTTKAPTKATEKQTQAPTTAKPTVAPTQAPTNEVHMNLLGIDYIYQEANYDRVCRSEEEILQAMLDGFNYGRTKGAYSTPVELDAAFSADCRVWANRMAEIGICKHSSSENYQYRRKHTDLASGYTGTMEGVGTLNMDTHRASYTGSGYINYCSEYENYVSYKTAFDAGEAMCYHISAQKKDVGKLGIGIAFGRDQDDRIWDSVDYYVCVSITYK